MPDLPSEPSLQQLRHQARDLQRAVRRGDQDALAELSARHPAGPPDEAAAAVFPLSAAQLVVARRYDFPSWARLRRYVEVVERYSRFPERMVPGGPDQPADEFLRLACLYYEDDEPGRWAQAHQILLGHPEITRLSVYAAAVAADPPWRPTRRGWPRTWPPTAARRPGRAARSAASRCSTWPTPVTTPPSARPPRSPAPGCCSRPERIRTPATCGTACRPRSPC
jgi:hypothetical protein